MSRQNIESLKDMLESVTPLTPESTVGDALQAMLDTDTKVLPVCVRGKVVGVAVRDDLLRVTDPDTPVGPMHRAIEPLALTTPITDIARIMRRERIRSVPISDGDGQLLGMLDAFVLSLA